LSRYSSLNNRTRPIIKLIQTAQALVRDSQAPQGTKAFLKVRGDNTERVVLMSRDLAPASQPAETGPQAPPDAVVVRDNVTH
jgi:hypothetical protein